MEVDLEKITLKLDFESFNRFGLITRVLGLDIYSAHVNSSSTWEVKLNKPAFVWFVTLQTFFIFCSVKTITCSETLIGFIYKSNIYSYSEHLVTITGILLVLRIVVNNLRKVHYQLFIILGKLDYRLSNVDRDMEFNKNTKTIFSLSLLVQVILYVFRFFGLYMPFMYWNVKLPYYKLIHVIYNLVYVNLFIIRFSLMCHAFSFRYKCLNKILQSILIDKPEHRIKSSSFLNNVQIPSPKISCTNDTFSVLKEVYVIISFLRDINLQMNIIFGALYWLNILNGFIVTVSNMFYLIHVLATTPFGNEIELYFFISYNLQEILFAFLSTVSINVSYNTFKGEAAKTPSLVNEIINLDLNPQATQKAEQLSLLILHSVPRFSACGMFTLDIPFLLSFIGCVATYLIILLQISSAPSDEGLFSSNATRMGLATIC